MVLLRVCGRSCLGFQFPRAQDPGGTEAGWVHTRCLFYFLGFLKRPLPGAPPAGSAGWFIVNYVTWSGSGLELKISAFRDSHIQTHSLVHTVPCRHSHNIHTPTSYCYCCHLFICASTTSSLLSPRQTYFWRSILCSNQLFGLQMAISTLLMLWSVRDLGRNTSPWCRTCTSGLVIVLVLMILRLWRLLVWKAFRWWKCWQ